MQKLQIFYHFKARVMFELRALRCRPDNSTPIFVLGLKFWKIGNWNNVYLNPQHFKKSRVIDPCCFPALSWPSTPPDPVDFVEHVSHLWVFFRAQIYAWAAGPFSNPRVLGPSGAICWSQWILPGLVAAQTCQLLGCTRKPALVDLTNVMLKFWMCQFCCFGI